MSMRFCVECNNLLYPRENRIERKLEYYCKLCPFVMRDVSNSCVFVNELVKDTSTKVGHVLTDLKNDPTLQRSKDTVCAQCGHNESVFFQAEQHSKSTALELIYICCGETCGHKWMSDKDEGISKDDAMELVK